MVKFAQVVLGPAGSGKSTYCAELQRHFHDKKRPVHIINMDPAAEHFHYDVSVDIRDLVSVDDVTDELLLGPNGALVYCMEYLLQNLSWLEDKLDNFIDNDYVVFDFPGQIELYTHFPFMRQLVARLTEWNFRIQALYLLDSQFITDTSKFFGGCISALSAMVQLEVPHINVMSKMDLTTKQQRDNLDDFIYPEMEMLTAELGQDSKNSDKFVSLNAAMANMLDQFSMVSFVPLDLKEEESLADLLLMVDNALQYDDEVDKNLNYPDEKDEDEDEGSQDEPDNDDD